MRVIASAAFLIALPECRKGRTVINVRWVQGKTADAHCPLAVTGPDEQKRAGALGFYSLLVKRFDVGLDSV